MNFREIKNFIYNDNFQWDRISLVLIIIGVIGLSYFYFNHNISKSDLIELKGIATTYKINIETQVNIGRFRTHNHKYLELLINDKNWLRIKEINSDYDSQILKNIIWGKSAIDFSINKNDFKDFNLGKQVKAWSLIIDKKNTLIDFDYLAIDNKMNKDEIKYISIGAIILGFIYFITFGFFKKSNK